MSGMPPLTVHVANGQFLVWDAAVCRELSTTWRVVGETLGGRSSAARADNDSSSSSSSSSSEPPVDPPWVLSPAQVLHLWHQAPSLRLVDGSSVAALRARTSRGDHVRERLQAFQRTLIQADQEAARRAEQFKHKRRNQDDAAARAEADNASTTVDGDALAPSAKRHKGESGLVTAAESTSPASLDELVALASASKQSLPRFSSLNLALCGFPATDEQVAAHARSTGHPQLVTTTMINGTTLLMPRSLLGLDLRTTLAHPCVDEDANAKQAQDSERLLYKGICDALGLAFHDCNCGAAAGSPPLAPSSSASHGGFTSSPAFRSFLSSYITFRSLWSDGLFALPGAHFGADLVAYEDQPHRVHSTFMVRIRQPCDEEEADETEAGAISAIELSNLARMAAGVNKVVLLVQPVWDTKEEQLGEVAPATTTSSAVSASSSIASCLCVEAFRRATAHARRARLDASTMHWNLLAGLQHASYPSDHLQRAPLRCK